MVPGRIKTVLLFILVPVAVYLAVLNIVNRAEWKTPTDGLALLQSQGGVKVAGPGGLDKLPPGVSAEDFLVDINGISIRTLDDYFEVIDALASVSEGGFVADYTFRNASEVETTVPVRIILKSQLSRRDIPVFVVGFAFLVIGMLVFLRSVQAPGAFHFTLISLVAFILLVFRYSGHADLFDITVYWVSGVAFLLLPPLFVHFCFTFPTPSEKIRKSGFNLFLLYLPAIFLGLIHLLWFMGRLQVLGLPRTPDAAHVLDRVELTFFAVFFVLAAVILVRSSATSESPVQRKQLQWISSGTLAGLIPFGLFYVLPFIFGISITSWMELSILSLILIPLSFGYAVSRFRLPDVDLIFNRGIAYILASSALLAFYIAIALLIAKAVENLSPSSGFVLLAASALVVALLFAPLKDRIQELIDKRFYKDRYGYRQSLVDFARTLGSEINLSRLNETIADRIQKTLDVEPVAVFLREEAESSLFRLETTLGIDTRSEPTLVEFSEDEIVELGYGFDRFGSKKRTGRSVRKDLYDLEIRYIEPLAARGRIIGFLALGRRRNGDLLSSEDIELLSSLARYAAIAVDNALLYRSLESKASELLQLRIYSENVVESIRHGVAVVSGDGRITVWNDAMESIVGVNSADAVGKNLEDVFPANLVESLREIVDGPDWLVNGVRRLFKAHLKSPADESRLVNVTLSPFISYDNVNTGTLIVADDITEKTQLESQLQQAEKLSSIGLFAAGLAHEVNTPLAGISSYAQILLDETAKEDPRHGLLEKIERQTFRASEIINNLLNFARFSDSDFEEVSINSLVLDTLSLLEHQLRRGGIEVELDFDPGLPKTRGNGGKLQQVFMNLFLNARDSMPDGGHLSLKTFRLDSELVVQVEDSGVGISRENIKRIYDPFFTTKSVGKGTGLGLSISYGIIQEHSGRVSVQSTPGKGTTFSLYLPIKRIN